MAEGTCGQFSGDGLLLELSGTRLIRDGTDLAVGTLTISENELCWKSDDQSELLTLQYPGISVHAVSRDVSHFSTPCVFLLYNDHQCDDDDEEEEDTQGCEIRIVPQDIHKLDDIYQAISKCQELYPDPELSSDSEYEYEGEEEEEHEEFFTSEDGLQQLTVEGQAVLAHLESIIIDQQTNGGDHGELSQFEDANVEEQ